LGATVIAGFAIAAWSARRYPHPDSRENSSNDI
jgi:hypothetical protein